jgi:hypothetical protein
MTMILQFPGGGNSPTPSEKSANDDSVAAPPQRKHTKAASFAKGMIKCIWVLSPHSKELRAFYFPDAGPLQPRAKGCYEAISKGACFDTFLKLYFF